MSDQNGTVNFKIKKTTPLRKLMIAYCGRQGLSLFVVRFTFNGTRLRPEDAPRDHGMEDGDSIEVFLSTSYSAIDSDLNPTRNRYAYKFSLYFYVDSVHLCKAFSLPSAITGNLFGEETFKFKVKRKKRIRL